MDLSLVLQPDLPTLQTGVGRVAMITEAAIITALDKAKSLHAIQQRLLSGQKGAAEVQIMLLRLRDEKKVQFDINTGMWSKA